MRLKVAGRHGKRQTIPRIKSKFCNQGTPTFRRLFIVNMLGGKKGHRNLSVTEVNNPQQPNHRDIWPSLWSRQYKETQHFQYHKELTMKNRLFVISSLVLALFMFASAVPGADKPNAIKLPPPQLEGGKTLMQALKDRSSSRSFSGKELSEQTLSNLLWAAFGINRPDTGKRTAPSARNKQEIDVYVAAPKGLYLYHAKGHSLEPILADDIRAATGEQGYVADAAINLVYVADLKKASGDSEQQKMFLSAADTGFIGQNVYLYCASAGLVTVIRAYINRPALAKTMKLREDQRVILAQSIGYPKDKSAK